MGKRAAKSCLSNKVFVWFVLCFESSCSAPGRALHIPQGPEEMLPCSAVLWGSMPGRTSPTFSHFTRELSPVSLFQSLLLKRPSLVHLAKDWSVDFKKKCLKLPRLVNLPTSARSLHFPD